MQTSRARARQTGYLLVLAATVCYAAGGNAVKVLFRLGYQPLVLAQLRIGFAFAWILLYALIFRRSLLRISVYELPRLILFGAVAVVGVQLAYYLSIAHLNIAIAIFVQFTAIVAVTAWERLRRRQPVAGRVWLAVLLVLGGSFFMVGAYRPALLRVNLVGIGLSLIAAAFFAAFLLGASSLRERLHQSSVLFYSFATGTVIWAVYDLLIRPPLPSRPEIWGAMAVVGLLATLIPYGLELAALGMLSTSIVGIVATAEPVWAGLIAFVFLGETLELPQVMGAAVVCAGIVMVQAGKEPAAIAVPVSPG